MVLLPPTNQPWKGATIMTNAEMIEKIQTLAAETDPEIAKWAEGVLAVDCVNDNLADAVKTYTQEKEEKAVMNVIVREYTSDDLAATSKGIGKALGITPSKASAILRRLVKKSRLSEKKAGGLKMYWFEG